MFLDSVFGTACGTCRYVRHLVPVSFADGMRFLMLGIIRAGTLLRLSVRTVCRSLIRPVAPGMTERIQIARFLMRKIDKTHALLLALFVAGCRGNRGPVAPYVLVPVFFAGGKHRSRTGRNAQHRECGNNFFHVSHKYASANEYFILPKPSYILHKKLHKIKIFCKLSRFRTNNCIYYILFPSRCQGNNCKNINFLYNYTFSTPAFT